MALHSPPQVHHAANMWVYRSIGITMWRGILTLQHSSYFVQLMECLSSTTLARRTLPLSVRTSHTNLVASTACLAPSQASSTSRNSEYVPVVMVVVLQISRRVQLCRYQLHRVRILLWESTVNTLSSLIQYTSLLPCSGIEIADLSTVLSNHY